MTDPTPTPYASEYPEGKNTPSEDQSVVVDEVIDDPHAPAFDFTVLKDEKAGIYEAVLGDREIAGLPYNVAGDDRLVLLATSVIPEYRRQGIGTELIRRVLDDVRTQGKTVTIMCPVVRAFIDRNPEYTGLVDPEHPGVAAGRR
ncbi:GNAT family N-acetyltransferase [Nonomuraea sp. NPDC049421]|uniref:GNAT family N-acetyltransferase n=1 Tax=Nonomuraea sp. NPDC049421 TaxID=3155275 RepID=UPI0034219366